MLKKLSNFTKTIIYWSSAAASVIGLFITLQPADKMTNNQSSILTIVVIIFILMAFFDVKDEQKRANKTYSDTSKINKYMLTMLKDSGFCEICSRDASWISDKQIHELLIKKSMNGEVTFLVHKKTAELEKLEKAGAEIIEYGVLGFDPIARFTIVNAGNNSSSYVAVAQRKPNELHTIEELDSSHPTYSMARDLIRSIKIANDKFKKN